MTPFEIIKEHLQSGMVQGNMHACLRDTGRLAGGYAASGAIDEMDLAALGSMAVGLSVNKQEGLQKWAEAVDFGRREPVSFEVGHPGGEIDWNGVIGKDAATPAESGPVAFVKAQWLEDEEVEEPADWSPWKDLAKYLEIIFESEDHVGYVTEAWHNDEAGRWLPKRGAFDRTAGQLQALLNQSKDIGAVFGDTVPEVGAWIRFNALDGQGVKDQNVTKFRHALVECDNIPIPRQMALIRKMELPITALVHSGGKSLHAIVKVEANDYKQYQERVDYLFDVCAKNGLTMDRQNRNPSRLSRMPGITRDGRKQWLVATQIGKPSWNEWKDFVEEQNDNLPEIESLDIDMDKEPELAPEIIEGVLREGHKLLIAGPSKAGKSFALIQLAIAFAEGGEWLGWRVKQGRCLYVNLELDARSAKHRFWAIYKQLNKRPHLGNIDIWNMRGNALSLDKLTPKLIRRAKKAGYEAVIIDPIYKVLTGDENSAAEMAAFCNHFDRICLEIGAASIYCHHHSKGAQGQKSSKDRSSGSGVFARDPDAIIDLIELNIEEDRRKQIINRWECDEMHKYLDRVRPGWQDEVLQDDCHQAVKLTEWAGTAHVGLLEARAAGRNMALMTSGWRVETTLREFPTAPAKRIFFRYPVHAMDGHDLLKDAKAEGEESPVEKMINKRKAANKDAARRKRDELASAMEMARGDDGMVRVKDVMECSGKSETAIRNGVKSLPGYAIENGFIIKKFGKA